MLVLTNLLSNVENLPKIGPAAVAVRRQRAGAARGGRGGWGLQLLGGKSVTEPIFPFLCGPQGPCGRLLRSQDTVKTRFSQTLGCV